MSTRLTLAQQAKKCSCSLSLSQLETKKGKFEFVSDKAVIEPETYRELVLFSPSKASNLGEKITKRSEKHIDELVKEVTSTLDIKHTYFFDCYESKQKKEDLTAKITKDNGTFLCMYCSAAFLESFYVSVRNALAHGNIVKKGKFFYLYSVSSREGKRVEEKERTLSFLLKVYSFNNLATYINAFSKYK